MRFVAKLGLPTAEICVSPKPAGWRLGNAYFCRRPLYPRRLVIFEDAVRQLKGDELLAVVACAAGRINRWHKPVRFLFFTAFSLLFWWGFSLLAVWPDFYAMMNIEPSLAVVHGSVNPGLLLLITLTVVPIALYPLVLFVHTFTRLLDYDEDEYAVQTVGSKPLRRAAFFRSRTTSDRTSRSESPKPSSTNRKSNGRSRPRAAPPKATWPADLPPSWQTAAVGATNAMPGFGA